MAPRSETALHRLDEPIIRIIAVLSNAAWITVGSIGLMTNRADVTLSLWPAIIIAGYAVAQIVTGRYNVPATLGVGAAAIAIGLFTTPVDGANAPTVIALAALGTVLSIYIQTRLVMFVAAYGAAITVVITLSEPTMTQGLISGITGAVVFGFTTYVMRWVMMQISTEAERYWSLFHNSPIAMWEEDFRAVGLLLNELRARGDDLEEYLHDNPGAALRIAGLVEIKAANAAAVRLLEAESHDELLGEIKNRDAEAIESLTQQLLAVWHGDDHVLTEICDATTMQGNKIHLALSWSVPTINGKRDLAHVSVAAVDITESRKSRETLEGLLQSKEELVATVSHELRTPLTTVVGLADELSSSLDHFDLTELHELVSLIAAEGREVTTIVEDLLIAARAEAGELRLISEPFDLVHLAREVHRAIPEPDQVALFVPDHRVWAVGDPTRTRQIIRNLVVNAGRYGGPAVRICVTTTSADAIVEVRDNGTPLPFKERESIFERYYRARQVPGVTASVGLGLTVSRQLARGMGGDLTYSHDGEEAIFELTMLRHAAQPDTVETRQEAAG